MDLIEQYRALARYNSWMNRKLYLLSAALNDDQRKRDRGAFFRSIHGTLNHLLLTDRVQVSRFVAQPLVSRDQRGNPIEIRALSQELYPDFEVLRREREETDRFIEGWTQALTPDQIAGDLHYRAMADGNWHRHPKWWAITHMFNHQTHHRGQITQMLQEAGSEPGVTDFMQMMREESRST